MKLFQMEHRKEQTHLEQFHKKQATTRHEFDLNIDKNKSSSIKERAFDQMEKEEHE